MEEANKRKNENPAGRTTCNRNALTHFSLITNFVLRNKTEKDRNMIYRPLNNEYCNWRKLDCNYRQNCRLPKLWRTVDNQNHFSMLPSFVQTRLLKIEENEAQ